MAYASGGMPEQVFVVLLVWNANDDTDFPLGPLLKLANDISAGMGLDFWAIVLGKL